MMMMMLDDDDDDVDDVVVMQSGKQCVVDIGGVGPALVLLCPLHSATAVRFQLSSAAP
jgi:hypothetical protein